MTLNAKLKDESSRAITSLLVGMLEGCRNGEVELAEGLGLSLETIKKLDELKADQILAISSIYMKDLGVLDVFNLSSTKLESVIERVRCNSEASQMADEFLRHGACKKMMIELFGMRSVQVANRKKLLEISSSKGRLSAITDDEEQRVYDAWLATQETTELRRRLLDVSKSTNINLSKVYRFVSDLEDNTNPPENNAVGKCA